MLREFQILCFTTLPPVPFQYSSLIPAYPPAPFNLPTVSFYIFQHIAYTSGTQSTYIISTGSILPVFIAIKAKGFVEISGRNDRRLKDLKCVNLVAECMHPILLERLNSIFSPVHTDDDDRLPALSPAQVCIEIQHVDIGFFERF